MSTKRKELIHEDPLETWALELKVLQKLISESTDLMFAEMRLAHDAIKSSELPFDSAALRPQVDKFSSMLRVVVNTHEMVRFNQQTLKTQI